MQVRQNPWLLLVKIICYVLYESDQQTDKEDIHN